jgi:hypothetical protein
VGSGNQASGECTAPDTIAANCESADTLSAVREPSGPLIWLGEPWRDLNGDDECAGTGGLGYLLSILAYDEDADFLMRSVEIRGATRLAIASGSIVLLNATVVDTVGRYRMITENACIDSDVPLDLAIAIQDSAGNSSNTACANGG